MTNPALQAELLNYLDQLPHEQQLRVLDFARTVAQPSGKPGKYLLSFAGAIGPDDLSMMSAAIAQDCEQVDAKDW